MNEVTPNPSGNATDHPAAKNAKIIYILYLVSIVIGFTGLIGVVMAYVNKSEAPEWLQSHYQFLIRTFWIGCLYSIISIVLMAVFIGILMILVVLVWVIVRCVKGMSYLDKGQPHPNPTGWMFN